MREVTPQIISRNRQLEARLKDNLFVLLSFPRSGSHWTQRMIGEIVALRNGFPGASFGSALRHAVGFFPPFANVDAGQWKTPYFVATHGLNTYPEKNIRVYLRRDFESVLRSTRKAEAEMKGSNMRCWWGGTDEEVYKKWSAHVARGCALADAVIDYELTRADPTATVKLIGRLASLDLTRAEISAAVQAGSRQNMLKEQEACAQRQWDIVNREDKTNRPPRKEETL